MSPCISVIIPVFNTAPWLRRCLDSVARQTLADIEIICVNDGSTDQCADIIHEYARQDHRFLPVELGGNRGVSTARNIGLAAARAAWVGFVDSDDMVEPDFFASLYAETKGGGAEIVKGTCWCEKNAPHFIDEKYNLAIRESKYNFWKEFYSAIYNKNFLYVNNIFFLDKCIAQEDVAFAYEAALCANSINVVDTPFYRYYSHSDSASAGMISYNKLESMMQSYLKMLKRINNTITDENTYILEYTKQILSCLRLYTKKIVKSEIFTIHDLLSRSLIEFIDLCRDRTHILHELQNYEESLAGLLCSRDAAGLTAHFAQNDLRLLYMRSRIAKKLRGEAKTQESSLQATMQRDHGRFF